MSEEQTPVSDPFVGYADELLERATNAALELRTWDQPRIDGLIEAMAAAAFDARIELARLAHEETGMGVFEHKVQKNAWASLVVAQDLRGRRTVGGQVRSCNAHCRHRYRVDVDGCEQRTVR